MARQPATPKMCWVRVPQKAEGLVDFSSEELVEDSVVHFLGWMLLRCILYREKDTVSVSLSRMRHIIMCSHLSPSSSSTEIDYDHITSH